MGAANCRLTNTGEYVVRHNPDAYFTQDAAGCATDDVDLDAKLASKINGGNLRHFNLIVPNLLHDMHDGTIAAADTWLSQWLPDILNGPDYAAGNTAVVVTWDEPATSAPLTTPIETVVIAPSVPTGKDAGTAFDHCSMLKTIELELGKTQLGCAASASSWRTAFNL
jgi:acid phosphatase